VPRLMRVRIVLLLPLLVTTVMAMPFQLAGLAQGLQGGRPLPAHDLFVKKTRDNLLRSQREQFNYSYKERRTEFHVNPFGRMGTGGIEGWEVTPIENGTVILRKLIERDGKRVTDGEEDRIKVKEERRQQGRRTAMEDVVATLTFKMDRRESVNGRDTIVVTFTPRPDAEPQTREGRIAKSFTGSVWVDEAAHEVIRIDANAVDTISFGFGLIARLNEGSTVTLHREPIDGAAIWLPTSIRFAGEGRALLLRKLNVDQRIEWSEYRKVLNSAP
jgi:hypothetical protein